MGTHYDTLSISPTADAEDIRKAYRSLILAVHPDKHVLDVNYDDKSLTRVSRLQEAYSVLKNPETRAQYDCELRWNQAYDGETDVFDRIHISDMRSKDSNSTLLCYPCRCGDMFTLERGNDEMEFLEFIVGCPSCSLSLAVINRDS